MVSAEISVDASWRIVPPQPLHFVGWEWESVLVYAEGSGDTHQLSPLAATVLQILQDSPQSDEPDAGRTAHQLLTALEDDWTPQERDDLLTALEEALRGLQRIGLVRQRRMRA